MGELTMAAATAANGVHSMQAASATYAPTSGSVTGRQRSCQSFNGNVWPDSWPSAQRSNLTCELEGQHDHGTVQLLQDNWIDFDGYCSRARPFRSSAAQVCGAIRRQINLEMAHSTAGFLGITRQVPTCVLGSGQPAHRAAPQAHPPVRTCQHSQSRTQHRRRALNSWILHAVRSDQQNTKVDNSVLQLISDLTNKVDTEHAAILAENARGLEGIVDTSSEGLKQKVQQSIQKLQKGLLERETEVRMLVAVVRLPLCKTLQHTSSAARHCICHNPAHAWYCTSHHSVQSCALACIATLSLLTRVAYCRSDCYCLLALPVNIFFCWVLLEQPNLSSVADSVS